MKLIPIVSSNIAGIGWKPYDGEVDRGRMVVAFQKGGWYLYDQVDMKMFVDIIIAESHGAAFAEFKRVYAVPYRTTDPAEIATL